MPHDTLGRLTKIDPREVWGSEDRDFTPWLAREDNISVLGDALGLELEVEAEERAVGPFRADILCKDTADDSWVLIENQLEKTDHRHLGQLLTYASGLKAVTIVWVARRFHEEHRAALDWLNAITEEDFRFFGLEVELWRIGDSAPAPKFNVVSKPNEWSRQVGSAKRQIEDAPLTPIKALQLRYWQALAERMEDHRIDVRKPLPQHWQNFAIGKSGCNLDLVADTNKDQLRAAVNLSDQHAAARFALLKQDAADIEREVGAPLVWLPLQGKKSCRIEIVRDDAPLGDESRWPDYQDWMIDTLERLDAAFRERLRTIDPGDYRAPGNADEEGEAAH